MNSGRITEISEAAHSVRFIRNATADSDIEQSVAKQTLTTTIKDICEWKGR
jgi:hypothetical protein